MKWISNVIDKIIFAIAAICGLQIPGFIIQYSQHLSGHLDEAKYNLAKYQALADKCCNGDLNRLIMEYIHSNNPTYIRTGEIIQNLPDRVSYLQHSLDVISSSSLIGQITYLLFHLDTEIAKSVWEKFEFIMPLTLNAAICALVIGLIASLIYKMLSLIIRSITHSSFPQKA